MRNTISLLLLFLTISGFGQRMTFEDPDLTFSFKKPKNWQVFDDGYVVKVSPSVKDSADTYFSITYFEDAQPFGESLFADAGENQSNESGTAKITGETAIYHKKTETGLIHTSYTFKKYDQRFEIITMQPAPIKNPRNLEIFKRIIRSIRISD